MEKKIKEQFAADAPDELPLQTENPAFKPGEMIACAACRRLSAPTRLKCLYCGAALPVSEKQTDYFKPDLRKLELWEKGFNVIFAKSVGQIADDKLSEISALLKLEKEVSSEIFADVKSLPLARVETLREAELIAQKLQNAGIETKILADEDLNSEKPPRRLRGVDFWDDKLILILFNADEVAEIKWTDVELIVTGAVFERKVEATESRRKRGENKLLETGETASDELLFDIYGAGDFTGYRVAQTGFDFSCLGNEKSLLAVDNIKKLVDKLTERAPNVKIDADYLKIRSNLGNVWQVEERTDSRGLKRESFGSFNLGNVTTVNNAAQFTKYSRLQRRLK